MIDIPSGAFDETVQAVRQIKGDDCHERYAAQGRESV